MAWAPTLFGSTEKSGAKGALDFLVFYVAPNLVSLVYPSLKPTKRDWEAAVALLFRLHQPEDLLVWETRPSCHMGPATTQARATTKRTLKQLSEYAVPADLFQRRVIYSQPPFLAHAIPLSFLFQLVAAIQSHSEEKDTNVSVVPTVGDEGRNVLLLCCALVAMGRYATATEALLKIRQRATAENIRATTTSPSQLRYAGYFDRCIASRTPPHHAQTLFLKQILFFGLAFPLIVKISIVDGDSLRRVYRSSSSSSSSDQQQESSTSTSAAGSGSGGWCSLDMPDRGVALTGDVRIACYCQIGASHCLVFEIVFHSMFESATGAVFTVDDLDKCPVSRDLLLPSFAVNLVFDASQSSPCSSPADREQAARTFTSIVRRFACAAPPEPKPSPSPSSHPSPLKTPPSLLLPSAAQPSPTPLRVHPLPAAHFVSHHRSLSHESPISPFRSNEPASIIKPTHQRRSSMSTSQSFSAPLHQSASPSPPRSTALSASSSPRNRSPSITVTAPSSSLSSSASSNSPRSSSSLSPSSSPRSLSSPDRSSLPSSTPSSSSSTPPVSSVQPPTPITVE